MCWAHGGNDRATGRTQRDSRGQPGSPSRTVDLNHISVDLIDQDRDLKDYHRAEVRCIYVKFIIGAGGKVTHISIKREF